MKKMNFASVSCEIAVADNFYFSTESICEYGRDTCLLYTSDAADEL